MKTDYVWAMLVVVLHHKAWQLFVKECHAPVVAAPTVRHNHAKVCRLLRLNPSSNIVPLQESQVNVCPVNTSQRQLNTAIAYDSDVVGTKMDNLHFFV